MLYQLNNLYIIALTFSLLNNWVSYPVGGIIVVLNELHYLLLCLNYILYIYIKLLTEYYLFI